VPETLQTVIDRALDAYAALAELGEGIDDEWSYVNDLAQSWQDRLTDLADRRGGETVAEPIATAVDRASGEIGLIKDPHRAIDWLSTYPQVILLAMGEPS
jgi:hypothetical protein